MMIPDRRIVSKIQAYDKELYVKWNNRQFFFEVWRRCTIGHKLITPVTESIYYEKGKMTYVPLDERILAWLFYADSWRTSPREHAYESEKRWLELSALKRKNARRDFRDMAKDMWHGANNFFFTKHASKDGKPKFESKKPRRKWVAPDCRARTSPRLLVRTPQNIKQYFGN